MGSGLLKYSCRSFEGAAFFFTLRFQTLIMNYRIFFTIIFLAAGLISSAQSSDSLKFQLVSPEDFLSMIRFNPNAVVIDVRTRAEFKKGRIDKAINMPFPNGITRKVHSLNKESVLLLYCTTGTRSRWAASHFYDLGFRKIYSLDGGIVAWGKKGLGVKGRDKNNTTSEEKMSL
jgi:rhodanese-related sulfurtransferase